MVVFRITTTQVIRPESHRHLTLNIRQSGSILQRRRSSLAWRYRLFEGLTQNQIEQYNKNGYLVFPDAIPANEAAELLEGVRNVMKVVSEGGKGIVRHDFSSGEGKVLSPVGRVIATFEPGQ